MKGLKVQLKNHFQPLLWVRVNLFLLPSGIPGGTLVKSQCPVTLSPFKHQNECFSYEITSLLPMIGLHSCLYCFLIDLNLISQKYFSSLIKIKIRKNWNKEIPSNSHIAHMTMPLALKAHLGAVFLSSQNIL